MWVHADKSTQPPAIKSHDKNCWNHKGYQHTLEVTKSDQLVKRRPERAYSKNRFEARAFRAASERKIIISTKRI